MVKIAKEDPFLPDANMDESVTLRQKKKSVEARDRPLVRI